LDDDILINILGWMLWLWALDVVMGLEIVGFGCRELGDCGLRCHAVMNVVGLDVGLDVDGLDVVGSFNVLA